MHKIEITKEYCQIHACAAKTILGQKVHLNKVPKILRLNPDKVDDQKSWGQNIFGVNTPNKYPMLMYGPIHDTVYTNRKQYTGCFKMMEP